MRREIDSVCLKFKLYWNFELKMSITSLIYTWILRMSLLASSNWKRNIWWLPLCSQTILFWCTVHFTRFFKAIHIQYDFVETGKKKKSMNNVKRLSAPNWLGVNQIKYTYANAFFPALAYFCFGLIWFYNHSYYSQL